jgi:hypothetical protein
MVQRWRTHIIESLAVRKALSRLSRGWILRNLSERDYGIDVMAEHFDGSEPTGRIAFFQIKGTSKPIVARNGSVTVRFPKKTLGYAECFSVPFFLLYCSTRSVEHRIYYVWLQKYITTRLNREKPKWRTAKARTVSLEIPAKNTLPKDDKRLRNLCRTPQMLEEFPHFLELVGMWRLNLARAKTGHPSAIKLCQECLYGIAKLRHALSSEHAFFDLDDLKRGKQALIKLAQPSVFNDPEALSAVQTTLSDLNDGLEQMEIGIRWPSFETWKGDTIGDWPY